MADWFNDVADNLWAEYNCSCTNKFAANDSGSAAFIIGNATAADY
ncbi:hypothetical protein LDI01_10420 [Lentilactobacillus diolivorans]|uniref:Uncharacterized protein n=1 Tax=Lentilactobacillus diolivorans TaxID=179838 RepID=A0ABQ0XG87_9LACO|nr:hypothetical protein LDI01_10420 [Lentilactobacillus diolivorans]